MKHLRACVGEAIKWATPCFTSMLENECLPDDEISSIALSLSRTLVLLKTTLSSQRPQDNA
jgi:hypothetical protein